MRLNKQLSNQIKSHLLNYDPEIVEIIQFGSSVYAPRYATDLDLLVFTKEKKNYGGYLDALADLDFKFWVDLVVEKVDERLGSLANGLLCFNKILYGDGKILREATKDMEKLTYKEAKAELKIAKEEFKNSQLKRDAIMKDRYIKHAFNSLFHTARIASMVYLSTDENRWGEVKKMLPHPYQKEFENYISTLHVKYFYDGKYPKENLKEEFNLWYHKVKDYIKRLEEQT